MVRYTTSTCRNNILHIYTMFSHHETVLVKLLAHPFPWLRECQEEEAYSQTVTAEDKEVIIVGMVQGVVRGMVGV